MKLVKGTKKYESDEDGLSPFKRPVIQRYLEEAVRGTLRQLKIGSAKDPELLQREQHRAYRALIRMSARLALFMGYDLKAHLKLVAELYEKCRKDFDSADSKALPTPKFHNAVLSSADLKQLLKSTEFEKAKVKK
jgi:hypothetical protein